MLVKVSGLWIEDIERWFTSEKSQTKGFTRPGTLPTGIAECDNTKRQNQAIAARIEFQLDNIQDKNCNQIWGVF